MNAPDRVTSDLQRYEWHQARGDELIELAERSRASLVDEWIFESSDEELTTLLADFSGDEHLLNALRRMLNATAIGRNLGREVNREAVINSATAFCKLVRSEADRIEGDDLVQAEANRIDTECEA